MLSTLSSIPGWLLTFFSSNFELVIGYIICVLFPIPFVNSTIISLWSKLLNSEAAVTTPTPTPTPTPPAA